MNVSQSFISEIDKVARKGIPVEVMKRARHSLLDYLAVTCAGAAFQKDKLKLSFGFLEPEPGLYKAIGLHKNIVLKDAVFINGLNAHALDFDDGTNSGIIHLGSPIFSLLIPLAQRFGVDVESMLKAAIIGYEASYTMAVSIQPRHKALGYHATGTCGVIGATLAASYMLGFTEEERFQAFATACVSASGMLKVLDDGSELKPYNVAKTALLALTSLQLAKAGFKGHPDPLGGYRGFLKMMTGDENVTIKPTLQNGSFAIMKTYTKPYASCRYTHPPVEAAIRLRNKFGIKCENIDSVVVETYDLAVAGHDHTDVNSVYSAKMSTPFSVAVALEFGKAGLQEFCDANLQDEKIKDITKKVAVAAVPELSRIFPEKQSAIVFIRTCHGTYSERVDYPKGEPENPFSEQEFHDRFADLMSFGGIDEKVYEAIYHHVVNQPDVMVSFLVKHL